MMYANFYVNGMQFLMCMVLSLVFRSLWQWAGACFDSRASSRNEGLA